MRCRCQAGCCAAFPLCCCLSTVPTCHCCRLKLLPWNQAKTQRLQAALDDQLLAILHRRLAAMGVRAGGSSSSGGGSSSAGGCPFHSAAGAGAAAAAAESAGSSGGGARDILSLAVEVSAQGGEVDEQMLLSQARRLLRCGSCMGVATLACSQLSDGLQRHNCHLPTFFLCRWVACR